MQQINQITEITEQSFHLTVEVTKQEQYLISFPCEKGCEEPQCPKRPCEPTPHCPPKSCKDKKDKKCKKVKKYKKCHPCRKVRCSGAELKELCSSFYEHIETEYQACVCTCPPSACRARDPSSDMPSSSMLPSLRDHLHPHPLLH